MGRILIIGAGVGGLAAAIDLAARGQEVLVLERAHVVGGKIQSTLVGDLRIDAGPTVLTMRWVFEELFASAGADLAAMVGLERATVLARHTWPDRSSLDLFADEEQSADAIGVLAGAAEAAGYRRFSAYARRIHEAVEWAFLRAARPTAGDLLRAVGKRGLGALADVDGHRTLWRALTDHFADPRLLQLFGRYATYCGSSPFHAPATLNVIAHVEREGVWLVEGGMGRLASAMARLAEQAGAEIRCGVDVAEVVAQRGRATGVLLATGEHLPADAVVMNGDAAALSAGLLGRAAARGTTPPKERSLSAVTLAIAADTGGAPLLRHNVFFSSDTHAEFAALFDARVMPAEPTVYVCAQDRGGADGPPAATPERLLCVLNAPARGDHDPLSDTEITQCETATMQWLERACPSFRLAAAP